MRKTGLVLRFSQLATQTVPSGQCPEPICLVSPFGAGFNRDLPPDTVSARRQTWCVPRNTRSPCGTSRRRRRRVVY